LLTALIGGQKARFVCLFYACLELPCGRAVDSASVLKEEHGRQDRQVSGELYVGNQSAAGIEILNTLSRY
jgi:hypothetical protein